MNAHELANQLLNLPGDFQVFLASDEEGNDFHSVSEIELSFYSDEWKEVVNYEDYEENTEDLRKIIIIWP